MRLPFVTTTSRSSLSKVWHLSALPETMKYQVGVWRELVCLMGREGSLALVSNLPRDGVSIKTLAGRNLKLRPQMSVMSNINFSNKEVNETGTCSEGLSSGRCPVGEQHRPGCHPGTARMTWTKEINKATMKCFYLSEVFDNEGKPVRGYRKRMFKKWQDLGGFEIIEHRLCDQARTIRKNGRLSDLELEAIRREINNETQEERDMEEGATTEGVLQDQHLRQANDIEFEHVENEHTLSDVDLNEKEKVIMNEIRGLLNEGKNVDGISFKKVDFKRLHEVTAKANAVVKHIPTNNINKTNDLVRAVSAWVAIQLGLKKCSKRSQKDPWWKRRIEGDIKSLRQEVNILERERNGELHYEGKRKYKGLEKKYGIRRKGLSTALEELKQRMIAKSAKLKRYEQRIAQYRQNRLFRSDQKKFYNELNGSNGRTCEVPDAGETRRFWSDTWGTEKQHNKNAEWLKTLKVDQHQKQQKVVIDHEKVTKQCRKISNWKAPGKDGVQGFWLKKLTNIHERIAEQLNLVLKGLCLNG